MLTRREASYDIGASLFFIMEVSIMFSEIINKLKKWKGKDVVIVADTINRQGNKTIVTYHGELLQAEHHPLDHNALFSVDEL
jgi:hypothetical protein